MGVLPSATPPSSFLASNALNICCDIWRKVNVEEFVAAARELKRRPILH